MKKICGILVLVLILCGMRSGGKRVVSIVADGIRVIPPCTNCIVTPFEYEGKIGFARNSSDMFVIIDPVYDDLYNDYQSLCDGMFSVKKNGKWGAVDSNNEYGGVSDTDRAVPCIYDTMSPWRKNKNGKVFSQVTIGGKTFYIDRKNNRYERKDDI